MAQNYTDSARGVLRSVNGQDYTFTPSYLRKRDPTSTDIKPKEQQGHYPVSSLWTNTIDQNVWVLGGIVNNLAKWILITDGGSGPLLNIGVPNGTSPITADINGRLNFTSTSGTVIITGIAGGVGAQDINLDIAGGADAVESITGDDSVAVVPSAGNINLEGNIVANATHAKAVYVESPAAHIEKIDVQVAAAIASTDVTKVGLSSYDETAFGVDANGFVTANPILQATNGTYNLGISYSSSTFSICSANGSALSTTNPGYIWLQSGSTPGELIRYKLTANQSFIDHTGSSQITGNSFGVSNTSNVYASDIPFYIYAVSNSGAASAPNTIVTFMICRMLGITTSPLAAKIAKSGSAVASTQGSFFALNSSITVSDYASSPCMPIGSFRMQMPASNDWTVSALAYNDGIGNFNDSTNFSVPSGSFGAASGSFFTANSGDTPPQFTSSGLFYNITRRGDIFYTANFATCNSSGSGTHALALAMPLVTSQGGIVGTGFYFVSSTVTLTIGEFVLSGSFNTLVQSTNGGALTGLTNGSFTTGNAATVAIDGEYNASLS